MLNTYYTMIKHCYITVDLGPEGTPNHKSKQELFPEHEE